MTVEMARGFLGWCTLLNVGLLIWWFLCFWLAHDWMHHFHRKIFNLSVETFDSIHYAGMAIFKIGIFLLNLVPYLVLAMIGS